MQMKRSDLWRLSYAIRPYLSHLTLDELTQRCRDIMANVSVLTPEGQLGLEIPGKGAGFPWMELWTHVLEEFGRRAMGMPADCLDRDTMPRPTAPTPAKGFVESQKLTNIDKSRCLVKFGNKSWLKTTVETGEWRVSPASYYSREDNNKARRDSELELPIKAAELQKTQRPVAEIPGEFYHRLGRVASIDCKAATNYYLVSLARGLIYRMFDDFHADACLIIRDEDEFARRMLRAFSSAQPRWFGTFKAVDYIDPCNPKELPDVYFSKHFRYFYQQEMRFVWTPSSATLNEFPQFSISLGPLADICELLTLDPT